MRGRTGHAGEFVSFLTNVDIKEHTIMHRGDSQAAVWQATRLKRPLR